MRNIFDLLFIGICIALIVLVLVGVLVPEDRLRQTLVIVLAAFVAVRRTLGLIGRRGSS